MTDIERYYTHASTHLMASIAASLKLGRLGREVYLE